MPRLLSSGLLAAALLAAILPVRAKASNPPAKTVTNKTDGKNHKEQAKKFAQRLSRVLLAGYPVPAKADDKTYYAAMAYSKSMGYYSWCWNASTRKDAESGAVKGCKGDDAKVVLWVRNGYIAVAVGNDAGAAGWAAGTTVDEAITQALKQARKVTTGVYLWRCFSAKDGALPTEAPGKLTIKVPEGAKVFIDDQEMAVSKGKCQAKTPNKLKPRIRYFYKIKVTLTVDEKVCKEVREVGMFANRTTYADFSDIAKPNKKKRTDAYWRTAVTMLGDGLPARSAKADAWVAALRKTAKEIDALPIRGVDTKAVLAMHDATVVYTKLAAHIEKRNRLENILAKCAEAFVRGCLGEPFKVADESSAEDKAIGEAFSDALTKVKKVQKYLITEYDLDFSDL